MDLSNEITIVIPTLNEEQNLEVLLSCLSRQDIPGLSQIKIYIADAGSHDLTTSIARGFALPEGSAPLNIEVIDGGMPGVGRNAGARRASTRYVLFIDADTYISDVTLLRRAIEKIKTENKHLISTYLLPRHGNIIHWYLGINSSNLQFITTLVGKPFCPGIFMLWNREEFWRLGGFDERFHYAEDYALSRLVQKGMYKMVWGVVWVSPRRIKRIGYKKTLKMFFKTWALRAHPDFLSSPEAKEYWN